MNSLIKQFCYLHISVAEQIEARHQDDDDFDFWTILEYASENKKEIMQECNTSKENYNV